MNKKSQGGIITIILIILLVLATIVIVLQVVNKTVVENSGKIEAKFLLIGVALEVEQSKNNFIVKRTAGGGSIDGEIGLIVNVNKEKCLNCVPVQTELDKLKEPLSSVSLINIPLTNTIEVEAILVVDGEIVPLTGIWKVGSGGGDDGGGGGGGSASEGTCSDKIQNCHESHCEEGVDCGGPCLEVCPTCFDGFQNQDETDKDCGGIICEKRCSKTRHEKCLIYTDCEEGQECSKENCS